MIEAIGNETDTAKRNALIAKVWDKVIADQVYVAIHHQMLAHAMKNDMTIPVRPDNVIFFKDVAFKKS
jgi:peptide/nickel transport system substrate-binding protein